MVVNARIAQNIAETCQKYFQSFIGIENIANIAKDDILTF